MDTVGLGNVANAFGREYARGKALGALHRAATGPLNAFAQVSQANRAQRDYDSRQPIALPISFDPWDERGGFDAGQIDDPVAGGEFRPDLQAPFNVARGARERFATPEPGALGGRHLTGNPDPVEPSILRRVTSSLDNVSPHLRDAMGRTSEALRWLQPTMGTDSAADFSRAIRSGDYGEAALSAAMIPPALFMDVATIGATTGPTRNIMRNMMTPKRGYSEGGEVYDDEGIDEAAELGRIYSAIQRYGLGQDGPEYVLYPEPDWPAGMPTVNRSFGGSENESDPGGDGRGQTGQEGQNDATGPGTGSEGGDGGGSSGSEGASGVGGDVGGGTEGNAEGNAEGEQGADAAAAPADGPQGLGAVAAGAAVAAQAPAADPESAVANNMNTPDQTSEIGFQGPSLGQMLGINEAQAAVAPDHLGLKSATDRATDYADLDPLGTIQGLVEGLSAPAPGFNTATSPLGSNLGLGLGDQATEAAQALGYGVAPGPATEAPAPGPSEDFDGTFGLADLSAPTPGPVGVATAATIGAPTAPTAPTEQPVGHPAPPSRDPTLGLTAPNFTTHDPTEVGRFGIPGLTPGFAPTNLDTLAETRQQAALEAEEEQQIRDMELAQLFDPTLMGPPQNFQAPAPVDTVTDPYGRMAANLETRSPAQQTQDMAVAPAPAPPLGPDEFSLNLPEVPEVHTVELPETVPQTIVDMIATAWKEAFPTRAPEVEAQMRSRQQPGLPTPMDQRAQRAADRQARARETADYMDRFAMEVDRARAQPKEQAQLGTAPAAVAAAQQVAVAPAVEAPPAPEVVEAPAPEVAPAPSAPNRAATAAVQSVQPSTTTTRSTTQAEEEEPTSPLTFSVQPRAPAPEPPARPTDMVPIGVPSDRWGPMVTEVKGHPTISQIGRNVMGTMATGILGTVTGAPIGLMDRALGMMGYPSIGGLIGKSQPAQTNAPYGNDEGQGSYGGPLGSFAASLPSGVAGPTPGPPAGEMGDPMEYDPRDFLGYPEDPETYGQRQQHRYYSGGGLVRAAQKARALALGEEVPFNLADVPRLTRADMLGYKTPAYHGTFSHIDAFEDGFRPLSHFGTPEAASDRIKDLRWVSDPYSISNYDLEKWAEKLGLSDGRPSYRWEPEERERIKGRLMTEQPWIGKPHPAFGEKIIDPDNPTEHILPVRLNLGRSLNVPDNGLGNVAQHAEAANVGLIEAGQEPLPRGRSGYSRYDFDNDPALLGKVLKERGFDSMHYRNNQEDAGSISYIITRPNQVRSIFAKFDPRKLDSGDIMAGVAPLGAAGAIAANQGDDDMGPLARYARGGQVKGYALGGLTGVNDIRPLAMTGGLGSGGAENLSYAPTNPTPTTPIPPPAGQPGTSFNPITAGPSAPEQGPLSYGGMGDISGSGGNGMAGVWTPWGIKGNAYGSGWGAGLGGGLVGGQASTRTFTPPVNPGAYGYGPQQKMWG